MSGRHVQSQCNQSISDFSQRHNSVVFNWGSMEGNPGVLPVASKNIKTCKFNRFVQIIVHKLLNLAAARKAVRHFTLTALPPRWRITWYLGPFTSTADVPGRRVLHSAGTNRQVVPPVRLTTVGSRSFPVAATQIWNSIHDHIISAPTMQSFRRHSKTFCYNNLSAYSILVQLVFGYLGHFKKSLTDWLTDWLKMVRMDLGRVCQLQFGTSDNDRCFQLTPERVNGWCWSDILGHSCCHAIRINAYTGELCGEEQTAGGVTDGGGIICGGSDATQSVLLLSVAHSYQLIGMSSPLSQNKMYTWTLDSTQACNTKIEKITHMQAKENASKYIMRFLRLLANRIQGLFLKSWSTIYQDIIP